jgi:hypothetical protein
VLDPAPAELEEAESYGIETVCSLVEDWHPAGQTFDVVGMFQTVDHLLDVAATLEKLRLAVRAGGVFFVDIVDFRAAYLRNWSVEGAVKIDHPYYLTQESMEAYLARAGFAVARKYFSSDHLHVGYVCRPSAPQQAALPSPLVVREFFRELRFAQNAPAPTGLPR